MNKKSLSSFAPLLMHWHGTENFRSYPWRGVRNPYLIWLSEIILQQTRSDQGLPYYIRFKTNYPNIRKLADADLNEVLRDWQGLGYYSRARNLHETAKTIVQTYKGIFPNTYNEIIKLKGIGEYTAAAISSFAFDEARSVVDGNVIRILARVFGVELAFDTTLGKKAFRELADSLLDKNNPATYNQAIMDFGATICTPKPKCDLCLLTGQCFAFKQGLIEALPIKSKKIKIKERYFYYLLLEIDNTILLNQRKGKDIWQELWELPMFESEKPIQRNLDKRIAAFLGTKKKPHSHAVWTGSQLLSHQKIHSTFIAIKNPDLKHFDLSNFRSVPKSKLPEYAFPKTVHLYLSEKGLI